MYKGLFAIIACLFLLLFSSLKNESHAVCIPPAKIVGDSYPPTSIQDAYDYASQTLGLGNFVLQLAGEIFTEDLFLDKGALVVLDGGYDCSFTTKTSTTGIWGTINLSTGAANFTGNVAIVSTDRCDFDADFDGYLRYTQIGDCVGSDGDCDDNNPDVNPAAVEICDGIDNNCDSQIDEGVLPPDADGDGYYAVGSCANSPYADDCDDTDATIHSNALDIPFDEIDQDCNGADLTFDGEVCVNCHGSPGGGLLGGPEFWTGHHEAVTAPDHSCAGCHLPLVSNVLPGHYGRTVLTAGNGMTAGMSIACQSCHDPNSPPLHPWGSQTVWPKVLAAKPNINCDTCHEDRAAVHEDTALAHDNRAITAECGNCHTGSSGMLGSDADVYSLHRSDCLLCHNYTGSTVNAVLVRQTIQQGFAGTQVDCDDCHNKGVDHHGSGSSGSGSGCVDCHGHDPGTLFDPDSSVPYSSGTVVSQGAGTVQSHSTHTELDSDDVRGPGIYCDSCHDINNFPYFKSGTEADGDGRFNLTETDVCDNCHSAGGAYDGIDDGIIGAKNNWSSGVYSGADLTTGKERWCVGCHDSGSSIIAGRQAPDIAGNDSTWGYYVSGHGGVAQECGDCHGVAMDHSFDGIRTYLAASDNYKLGFRLKDVAGTDPMNIPNFASGCGYQSDDFKLCWQCHDEQALLNNPSKEGFLDCDNPFNGAFTTGFRNESLAGFYWSSSDVPANIHWDHLEDINRSFGPDWNSDGTGTEVRTSCPACHNVHGADFGGGTPTLKMTRSEYQLNFGTDGNGDYGQVGPGNSWNQCSALCHGGTGGYKYYRSAP